MSADTENLVRPFHCGSQAGDWMDRNCDRCVKGYDDAGGVFCCDIQEALTYAWIGDGTVSWEIGRRMGHVRIKGELPAYGWRCPEFVRAEFPAGEAVDDG